MPVHVDAAALLAAVPDTVKLPYHATRDREWVAALLILTSIDPGADARIWRHVSYHGIDFTGMLGEAGYSSGERLAIQAAASLWNGYEVSLADLAASLDDQRWRRLMQAIAVLREGLA